MAPTESGLAIVRRWTSPSALTGAGERYQTADGRVWKPCAPYASNTAPATGVSRGWLGRDRVYSR